MDTTCASPPEDGATARYNQTVYGFWFTSVTRQYVRPGRSNSTCSSAGAVLLSVKNDMLWYHLIQLPTSSVYPAFGLSGCCSPRQG